MKVKVTEYTNENGPIPSQISASKKVILGQTLSSLSTTFEIMSFDGEYQSP